MEPQSHTGRTPLLLMVLAALVLGGGVAVALIVRADDRAKSDPGSPAVDFTKLTPLPFKGYPTTIATPDLSVATCQAPVNERPSTELPPLSCRSSASEPPAGAIATALPGVRPIPKNAPADWQVIDNELFRYVLAIPAGWYSNMRPEGGTFQVSDATATGELTAPDTNPVGGVLLGFSARKALPPREPDGFLPDAERHLTQPSTTFGSFAGAIWDEGPGEGLAHFIHAVFVNGDILFQVDVNIADDGRKADDINADLDLVMRVLTTITPY